MKNHINGVFDIYILDPLPEQMVFETSDSSASSGFPYGSFTFCVDSNDKACVSGQTPDYWCNATAISYIYSTQEIDDMTESYLFSDAEFSIPSDKYGKIYFWRCWTCGLNDTIQAGAPDYYDLNGEGFTQYNTRDELFRFSE